MGTLSSRIFPEPLRSIDSATFTGVYQAVGTPLANLCRVVKFTNDSNVTVLLSWDGITDHEILPAGGFFLLDVSANKEVSRPFDIAAHTQFFVKGAAGGGNAGSVFISVYFGQ